MCVALFESIVLFLLVSFFRKENIKEKYTFRIEISVEKRSRKKKTNKTQLF